MEHYAQADLRGYRGFPGHRFSIRLVSAYPTFTVEYHAADPSATYIPLVLQGIDFRVRVATLEVSHIRAVYSQASIVVDKRGVPRAAIIKCDPSITASDIGRVEGGNSYRARSNSTGRRFWALTRARRVTGPAGPSFDLSTAGKLFAQSRQISANFSVDNSQGGA